MKTTIIYLLILVICCCPGCKNSSDTERYQNKRNNILFVKEYIKEIEIEDVLIGQFARLYTINNYLLISDGRSIDKLIHIFNKNNYNYVTSIIDRGQGANEIASIGFIGINEANNKIYVTDYGKQTIFDLCMDSVITNPRYIPQIKMTLNERQFPDNYQYINDTLLIGRIVEPTGNSGYNHTVAKIKTNTGEIKLMKYKHPKIEKKRICFAASTEHNAYVECYHYHDLMTFYDLDGNFKYNIYGKKWDNKTTNKFGYYEKVLFCNDKIIVSYGNGKDRFSNSENGYPTQLLIFSIDGTYIQTLETEYSILDFCYDKDNNRIIMSLDENIQFAYLSLDKIIS
ncbi:MAG: 6-bladed beta-propeller [Tannerella sp.]|jgi:hypothetical protein|nr:6-bladed beta-propeller [Tannerella sp.]